MPQIEVCEPDQSQRTTAVSKLTDNQRMELLSLSYIRAVAADAGFQVTHSEIDMDSTLSSGEGRRAKIDYSRRK